MMITRNDGLELVANEGDSLIEFVCRNGQTVRPTPLPTTSGSNIIPKISLHSKRNDHVKLKPKVRG